MNCVNSDKKSPVIAPWTCDRSVAGAQVMGYRDPEAGKDHGNKAATVSNKQSALPVTQALSWGHSLKLIPMMSQEQDMGYDIHPSRTPHLSALGPEGDWRIPIRSHQTSGLHLELGGVGLERETERFCPEGGSLESRPKSGPRILRPNGVGGTGLGESMRNRKGNKS